VTNLRLNPTKKPSLKRKGWNAISFLFFDKFPHFIVKVDEVTAFWQIADI
jgi:hypothetical protein